MKVLLSFSCAILLLLVLGRVPQSAQTRRPLRDRPDLTNSIIAMRLSPDGHLLAVACGLPGPSRVELWETRSGTLLKTIQGFDGPVTSVSFSPDGRTLLTGSSGIHLDKISEKISKPNGEPFTELKWWDAQTGEFKQRFELKDQDLMSVAVQYSPDGKFLAAYGSRSSSLVWGAVDLSTAMRFMRRRLRWDSQVRLLDAATGERIFKLDESFDPFYAPFSDLFWPHIVGVMSAVEQRRLAIFSPDGQYVAAWNSKEVRLWRRDTGAEVLKLKDFEHGLGGIGFSPDGSLLATALTRTLRSKKEISFQSEVRVWEIPTGTARKVIPLNLASVTGLVFAPNGQQLLVSGLQPRDGHVYASFEVADLATGSMALLMARDEGASSAVEMSSAGDLLVLQTDQATIKLLDLPSAKVRFTFDTGAGVSSQQNASLRRYVVSAKTVTAVGFLPDNHTIVGEIDAGGVKTWDARTGEVKKVFAENAETGAIAELSKQGDILAEITPDENVRVWSVAAATSAEITSPKRAASAIALAGNGKTLGVVYPAQIDVFNIENPAQPRQITIVQGRYVGIALSADGAQLAGVTAEGNLNVWNTADGIPQKNFAVGPGVSAMRFTPNGQALAIGMKDGRASLWHLAGNVKMFESKKHSAAVTAIAFSSEGTLMATGSDDRTAVIWELPTGNARRTLKGHDFTVTSIAFSADGNLLAVAGGNASVALWEVATGKLNRILR